MDKKLTNIKIDAELWERVLRYCRENELDTNSYVEEAIIKELIRKDLKE